MQLCVLSFEGPDRYPQAGGIATRFRGSNKNLPLIATGHVLGETAVFSGYGCA